MSVPFPRPASLNARLETPIEEWAYLDEALLQKTRSRKVCMTCHWFRHHTGARPMTWCARRAMRWRWRKPWATPPADP